MKLHTAAVNTRVLAAPQLDLRPTLTTAPSFHHPQTDHRKKTICSFWIKGTCRYGDANCKYLHSWRVGDDVTLVATLDGHKKSVTGIVLPPGSDKLYTGSKDGTVRVWDCSSGQCLRHFNLGGEVGCMLAADHWVLVGLPNAVRAFNTKQPSSEFVDLASHHHHNKAKFGQVYAMAGGNGMLFAATQSGEILTWKCNAANDTFEPDRPLQGHAAGVVSLAINRGGLLYSGSVDKSIKVWSLEEELKCVETISNAHDHVVMSVLSCSDTYLFSCGLDDKLKIWSSSDEESERKKMELNYSHGEEHGFLAMCGTHDSEGKAVLLCSCNDDTLRIYDLPSFSERGRIYSKGEIREIKEGPRGMFFTGHGTGPVRVWKLR